MSDFFEQVKVNASKTKDEAVKIGKQVVDKASNVMSRTKINFAINDAEIKIKDVYSKIGQKVYSEYLSGNEVMDGIENDCAQIDKLFEDVNALKEKLAELKNSAKCANCGTYNEQDSVFCSKCGTRLSNDTTEEETVCEEVFDEDKTESETVKRVITIRAKRPERDD